MKDRKMSLFTQLDWSKFAMQAPATTAFDLPLYTVTGETVQMSEIWRHGTTAFTFVRYLSCLFCKEQVREYNRSVEAIAAAGLRVVIVTPASVEDTVFWAQSLDIPYPIYCDPEQATYAVYGFVKGSPGQLVNPRIIVRGARAVMRGNLPALPKGGDPRQLPGTAIVSADGRLLHHHIARDASDYLALDELLEQAKRIEAMIAT